MGAARWLIHLAGTARHPSMPSPPCHLQARSCLSIDFVSAPSRLTCTTSPWPRALKMVLGVSRSGYEMINLQSNLPLFQYKAHWQWEPASKRPTDEPTKRPVRPEYPTYNRHATQPTYNRHTADMQPTYNRHTTDIQLTRRRHTVDTPPICS